MRLAMIHIAVCICTPADHTSSMAFKLLYYYTFTALGVVKHVNSHHPVCVYHLDRQDHIILALNTRRPLDRYTCECL